MTVEEKANKFLDKIGSNSLGSPINASYEGFLAGYEEAMRWRDTKEELPGEAGLYLCKCKPNRLGFYFEIVFFNKVWRSDKVIGWRPIE